MAGIATGIFLVFGPTYTACQSPTITTNGATIRYTTDGSTPSETAGTLYGTTNLGGSHNIGTVFQRTPGGVETVLYSFGSQSGDGYSPHSSLIMDGAGNLYGTTPRGGPVNNHGVVVVFKLAPSGGGWTETSLYNFCGQGARPAPTAATPKPASSWMGRGTSTERPKAAAAPAR